MDPLSITAGTIGILQISGAVIATCYNYRSRVKNASKDASRIINELNGLRTVIESLFLLAENASEKEESYPTALDRLASPSGPLLGFQAELEDLERKLEPKEGWQSAKAKLFWPLKEPDIRKILQDINSTKSTIQLALAADHRKATNEIQESVTSLAQQFSAARLSSQRESIFNWLQAPDAISTHTVARRKCQKDTGRWFLKGSQFLDWEHQANSFLWIHGIPGCGKTILSSTVIDHLFRKSQGSETSALAYFYFDFNDSERSKSESLVRSIVAQLFAQLSELPKAIDSLFSKSLKSGFKPSMKELLPVLIELLAQFETIYIIVDALDECVEREDTLKVIQAMRNSSQESLHFIATSRYLPEIEFSLSGHGAQALSLGQSAVSEDIALYISERLQNDRKLAKWPLHIQERIEYVLYKGARGMFRWVVCQFETLRQCLTIKQLEQELDGLPRTLEETYDRILLQISERNRPSAVRVLQWLAFAARPVTIEEAAEVLATEIETDGGYDPDLRLLDPMDIMLLCSTLITKAPSLSNDETTRDAVQPAYNEYLVVHNGSWVIRLAHLSVKDFLLSDRIKSTNMAEFALDTKLSHISMAKTCLVYLLIPAFSSGYCSWKALQTRIARWPLLYYAVHFWPYHVRAAGPKLNEEIWNLLQRFFATCNLEGGGNYTAWSVALTPDISKEYAKQTLPLYYAASFGIESLVSKLLENSETDIEARGGRFRSSPLMVAVYRQHSNVVKLLLDAKANPMVQDQDEGSPLLYALLNGSTEIQILLESHGAVMTESDVQFIDYDSLDKRNQGDDF